jgi:hypothetical protein
MEPRQSEQKNEQLRKEEEKRRPRFQPAVEVLEERISLSGLGLGRGGDHCVPCFHVHKGW